MVQQILASAAVQVVKAERKIHIVIVSGFTQKMRITEYCNNYSMLVRNLVFFTCVLIKLQSSSWISVALITKQCSLLGKLRNGSLARTAYYKLRSVVKCTSGVDLLKVYLLSTYN